MTKKTILIIDSDAASRNFIAHKMLEQGFDVIHAESGKEGLISTWRDRPDLVIIDPVIPDLKGEEFAVKLRQDARTLHLPLVALSSDHNPARARSCQEAGFDEYVLKSGQAVPMLTDALNHLFGVTEEAMKQGGLLIVFLSAKGGTGTSSICANIAMNLSEIRPEARIAVVDLVFPIGSIAPIVGYQGERNIVSIADLPALETSPDFFRRELEDMNIWRFNLLAGSPDPESSNQLKVGRIWDIITTMKSAYDFVLVDNGRSLSKITLPLIQHADLVALLISTDISTISLTRTLLDYLKNKGVHSGSIYSILNRAPGPEGLSKAEAEKLLGIQINAAFPYLGTNFAFANSHHQPFTLKFPNTSASIVFRDTAGDMAALARKLRGE